MGNGVQSHPGFQESIYGVKIIKNQVKIWVRAVKFHWAVSDAHMPSLDLTASQFENILKAAFHTGLTEFPSKSKIE